jgi:hypothetical protein
MIWQHSLHRYVPSNTMHHDGLMKWRCSAPATKKDRRLMNAPSRMEPLRASGGILLQWVGATLDIEKAMCAQEALRESETKCAFSN